MDCNIVYICHCEEQRDEAIQGDYRYATDIPLEWKMSLRSVAAVG